MFEEAQLYSPVTTADDGEVTVHLSDDHPGFNDAVYRERRNAIAAAALAWEPRRSDPADRLHRGGAGGLADRLPRARAQARRATPAGRSARRSRRWRCRPTGSPSSTRSTAGLEPLTGFRYVPAAGIVPLDEFYGSLADRCFHSTQYVRHHEAPLYTPEPDLIHEVIGHGHLLADPEFAELNRLAGAAARRMESAEGLQMVADVFWFTIEFGVVHEDGELRAYGAGILSSYGEIEEFRGDGDPAARLRGDGDDRLRHHPLPAGSLRGRLDRPSWSTGSAASSRTATTTPPRPCSAATPRSD